MRRFLTVVLSCVLGGATGAAAEPFEVGDRLPAVTFTDQHDVEAMLGPETRVILFARDMKAAEIVEEALAEDGARLLAAAGAVFVSDIHRMPRIITRMFALPAMRRRPYRMLLDRDGTRTANFPAQEKKVSFMRVEDHTIRRIDYVDSAERLRAALLAAPAEGPQGTGQ